MNRLYVVTLCLALWLCCATDMQAQTSLMNEVDMASLKNLCPNLDFPEKIITSEDARRITRFHEIVHRFDPESDFETIRCPALKAAIIETEHSRDALTVWLVTRSIGILEVRSRQLSSLLIVHHTADPIGDNLQSSTVARQFMNPSGEVDVGNIIIEMLAIYEVYQALEKEYGRLLRVAHCPELIPLRFAEITKHGFWAADPGYHRIDSRWTQHRTIHHLKPMCP